jgi:hypothetical protein
MRSRKRERRKRDRQEEESSKPAKAARNTQKAFGTGV